MSLANGHTLQERYRIDGLLGQGGMGAVYCAWDMNLNIRVAVKENLGAAAESQKQFVREAQMLARLSHPNLPRVTDYFSPVTADSFPPNGGWIGTQAYKDRCDTG